MSDEPAPLGIIAGGGDLPRMIVQGCHKQGRPCFLAAVEGEVQPEIMAEVPSCTITLARLGPTIKQLKEAGVEKLVLAGRVKRPALSSLRPDMMTARLLTMLSSARNQGDDAMLSTIIRFLEKQGFSVLAVQDVLEDIVARHGVMGKHRPDKRALQDIEIGAHAIRHMGVLDIGQAVVIQQGRIMAVEAAEGTDGMLSRVKPLLADQAGGVLVKAKKPGQEERVDMPAIGPDTVDRVKEAGLSGIAVEAGAVLMLDIEMVTERAAECGIFIYGFAGPDSS